MIGAFGLVPAFGATQARAGEGCDNGVPVGGTACAHQGDPVQYRCQPGSQPGQSNWSQESCNGGTCQGAACTGAPPPPPNPPPGPEGCDNGVPVGGTACAHQGEAVQYRCQPGSRPGQSNWSQESCNGGTCQGAACTGAPPPQNPPPPNPPPGPEGCDNGVPVGGTACANQGEDQQYRCLAGSRPGQSKWLPESCTAGRRCFGASCQPAAPANGCDGRPIGARECKLPASDRFRECIQGPQGAAWRDTYCPQGQVCSGGACVASPDTCAGAPLGSRKCDVEGGQRRWECVKPANGAPLWQYVVCLPSEECRAGSCVAKSLSCDGRPVGARKCDFEGDFRYFECVQAAGITSWAVRACGKSEDCRNGQCITRVQRCGDDLPGTRKCEVAGGFRVKECRVDGGVPAWNYIYCQPGDECQQGQCVPRQTTCEGAPIGTRKCMVEGGTQLLECRRPYADTPPQWATLYCGPTQTCHLGACMTLGKPPGAPQRHGRKDGALPRPQGRPE